MQRMRKTHLEINIKCNCVRQGTLKEYNHEGVCIKSEFIKLAYMVQAE